MFKYFTFFFKKKRIDLRDNLTLQFYLPMISFHQEKKRLKALGHTNTSPVVRPLPYAWAQTYHPSSVVAMDSCFSLVRPHQHGMANHPRSLVFSAGDGTGKNSRGVC